MGIAESYRDADPTSTLAGVITRADRVVDGFVFGSCTVGGTDATDSLIGLLDRLDRPDVRYVFLGAIAPAWYNLLDLPALAAAADRPVLAVTFEASPGLEDGLRAAFSGSALDARLDTYRRQPPRRELRVNDDTVFVRSVGFTGDTSATGTPGSPTSETPDTSTSETPDTSTSETLDTSTLRSSDTAAEVVDAFTPEGGRPEPLRIARVAARAAAGWLRRAEH